MKNVLEDLKGFLPVALVGTRTGNGVEIENPSRHVVSRTMAQMYCSDVI